MRYKCPYCKGRDIAVTSDGTTLCRNTNCLRVSLPSEKCPACGSQRYQRGRCLRCSYTHKNGN